MTLEEEMAVAVLKGEKGTALILAQKLMEEHVAGRVELPPIKTLDVPAGRKKMILVLDHEWQKNTGIYISEEAVLQAMKAAESWMMGKGDVLSLAGFKFHLFVEPEVKSNLTAEEIRRQLAEALRT
jgi:Holliday junction resolvase